MAEGAFFWMTFMSFCIVVIMVAVYDSVRRDRMHSINMTMDARMPAQPQKIDVHVHVDMPTGEEIGAGMVRQIQRRAAEQIEARGYQADWRVVSPTRKQIPTAQPRLGNQRYDIEVKR